MRSAYHSEELVVEEGYEIGLFDRLHDAQYRDSRFLHFPDNGFYLVLQPRYSRNQHAYGQMYHHIRLRSFHDLSDYHTRVLEDDSLAAEPPQVHSTAHFEYSSDGCTQHKNA